MQEITLICDLGGTLISHDELTGIELIRLLREFKSKSYIAVREILPLFYHNNRRGCFFLVVTVYYPTVCLNIGSRDLLSLDL